MKVTLLGAGSWGTAMAAQAARYLQPGDVCLWSRSVEQIEGIRQSGANKAYLPGIALPKGLQLEVSLERAIEYLSENDLLVIATPMSGLSETVAQVLRLSKNPLNIVVQGFRAQHYLIATPSGGTRRSTTQPWHTSFLRCSIRT